MSCPQYEDSVGLNTLLNSLVQGRLIAVLIPGVPCGFFPKVKAYILLFFSSNELYYEHCTGKQVENTTNSV